MFVVKVLRRRDLSCLATKGSFIATILALGSIVPSVLGLHPYCSFRKYYFCRTVQLIESHQTLEKPISLFAGSATNLARI
jgi:hypothetical protein